MRVELFEVYYINGHLAIKLTDLAKIVKYSDSFLLRFFKRLLKRGIALAYKWKRNWYVLLPKAPITKPVNNFSKDEVNVELPNGRVANFDWQQVLQASPPSIRQFFLSKTWSLVVIRNRVFIPGSVSSTLSPKSPTPFTPLSLGKFPATTDYKYGYYITYREDRMSTFDPGTGGTLNATQLPAAFFEVARALDAAEQDRNGANPGLTPRRNIATTVSFDTGTISVAATLPVIASTQNDGSVKLAAQDYLGATYSAFANGAGDLASDSIMEAFLEIASLLAAAEKAVQPTDAQPNNVQVNFDLETGSATVSANLPFTSEAANNGDVTIKAIDYL